MRNVGLGHLEPGKGYHFPDGPFVEYKGMVPPNELQSKRQELELEASKMIEQGGKVFSSVLSYEEAAQLCGGCLPDYIPQGSTPRIVKLGDNPGCPCGGTHVSDISEISNLKAVSPDSRMFILPGKFLKFGQRRGRLKFPTILALNPKVQPCALGNDLPNDSIIKMLHQLVLACLFPYSLGNMKTSRVRIVFHYLLYLNFVCILVRIYIYIQDLSSRHRGLIPYSGFRDSTFTVPISCTLSIYNLQYLGNRIFDSNCGTA
ncbi:hypothetical protein M9H77_36744 [Catharanthus roseus]|uniref:Uncharacterized protein n=1 Tax=Catharanthus roseus TaxID=4058 RepID=A0ACB9ZTQ0_CATRO|nr:hypothetical protein M9H77_36744 [Catharanthus roseus]